MRFELPRHVWPVEGVDPCPETYRSAFRRLFRLEAQNGITEALLLDQDLDIVAWVDEPDEPEPDPTLVSVIIPIRGAHDCLYRCLEALAAHTKIEDYEAILVCAEEERVDVCALARKHLPLATVACMNQPQGFPAAVNFGASLASGQYLCLLNSDAYVTPNWLGGLLRTIRANPHVAAVGPAGTNISGEQNTADLLLKAKEEAKGLGDEAAVQSWIVEGGAEFNRPPTLDEIRKAARTWKRGKKWQDSRYVDRLVGFCLLIHTGAFWRAGALWEGFGLGNFDDDDLCLRLLMLSHRLVLNQRVLVLHQMSASFKALSEAEDNPRLYQDLLTKNFVAFEKRWSWCASEIATLRQEARSGPAL